MKKYCFDTSGLSNPLQHMPQDLHERLWSQVRSYIESGQIGVTAEIYEELCRLPDLLGQCIQHNKKNLLLEVNDDAWDWQLYLSNTNSLIQTYQPYISEYNNNTKGTIGMNDLSIIALAKTLKVAVVSMEVPVLIPGGQSKAKRRIPDICAAERIEHLAFNDFLRREQILS